MTRILFVQFACGQEMFIYNANQCDSNEGTKTFPALLLDCPFLTGTPMCNWTRIHCTSLHQSAPSDVCSPWQPWHLLVFTRTCKTASGPCSPEMDVFLDSNCGNSILFLDSNLKTLGIWKCERMRKVYSTGTAMSFEPNSICKDRTPTRHPCRPASNLRL